MLYVRRVAAIDVFTRSLTNMAIVGLRPQTSAWAVMLHKELRISKSGPNAPFDRAGVLLIDICPLLPVARITPARLGLWADRGTMALWYE
jgi:hypothetical protein